MIDVLSGHYKISYLKYSLLLILYFRDYYLFFIDKLEVILFELYKLTMNLFFKTLKFIHNLISSHQI